MTLDTYLRTLRAHWRAVAAVALLGVLAGVGATLLSPKVYVATTTQFVRGVAGAGASPDYQAAQFATSQAKSYSALIGNPDVLSGVISQLGLTIGPADLLSRLTVENPTDTVLINVSARGTSAAQAQAISIAAADNLAKLILRLEAAGSASGKSPIDVQTAVPAPLPTSPSSPRPVLNIAVGTLLGLALGSILALFLKSPPRRQPRTIPRRREAQDQSLPSVPPAPARLALTFRNRRELSGEASPLRHEA